MSEKNNVISVQLLDRTYQLKCKPEEAEKLKEAAAYLDVKMHEIFDNSNTVGHERTAMLAAMGVCYELMCMRAEKDAYGEEMYDRIKNLQTKVESIVSSSQLNIPKREIGEQQTLKL